MAYIHNLVPEARIIFMLRNSIGRACSQLVMRLDRSGQRELGLTRYKKPLRNVEREGSRSKKDCLQALENCTTFYHEERIFVGFLEDIHFHPEQLLANVYWFLDVDPSFKPRRIGGKVHARSAGRMTPDAAVYLAGLYRKELSLLSEHFGGYASFWLFCAEKLAESVPEEEYLPYPLWESAIWDEWIKASKGTPGCQSDPLSSAETAF